MTDTAESQKILNQINGLDLPAEDKGFLFEEYARPLDIARLARDVDTPEQAVEVYAASLLMVDPPSPPEQTTWILWRASSNWTPAWSVRSTLRCRSAVQRLEGRRRGSEYGLRL